MKHEGNDCCGVKCQDDSSCTLLRHHDGDHYSCTQMVRDMSAPNVRPEIIARVEAARDSYHATMMEMLAAAHGVLLDEDEAATAARCAAVNFRRGFVEDVQDLRAERDAALAACAEQTARAERAEAERDAAIEGDAAVFFSAEDRARTEAERDRALAANAEMRAAAVGIDGRCRLCTARPREHRDNCALARPDLGRGWASPEDTAQLVGALQMVEGDGEFDSLHEVTRKFVVDVLALLGKAVGDEATPI